MTIMTIKLAEKRRRPTPRISVAHTDYNKARSAQRSEES